MKLLLDTCTFLWLSQESSKASRAAQSAFLDLSNERYLSAASVWEICLKHSAGKLALKAQPEELLTVFLEFHQTQLLPIDHEAAFHTLRLPKLHTDPFDRLLVAQAILHGLTILTPDPLIRQYPARTLW